MNCHFCNLNPPITNSHVVPKFIVKYIKQNSPVGFLLNSWSMRKAQDGIIGPYLCNSCDNVLFSGWENHFKKTVFDCADCDSASWSDCESIKFILSIIFRYTVHFLETSPTTLNKENNERFKKLSYDAINNLSSVGSSIFIYPYVFRPITSNCKFTPGINHFLNLAFHAISLPKEEDLPNAFLVILPSILILATDSDLSNVAGNKLVNIKDLRLSPSISVKTSNTNLPEFVAPILNKCIGQTQGHQRTMRLWNRIAYGADKLLYPNKMAYKSQKWDTELLLWQQTNCTNKAPN